MQQTDSFVSRAAFFLVAALVFAAGLQAAPPQLSKSALIQKEALVSIKLSKTAEQNKIDSRLYLGLLHQRTDPRLAPLTSFRFVTPQADGKVPVDVLVTSPIGVKTVLNRLQSLGGVIKSPSVAYQRINARVTLADLETLAAMPEVRKIRQEIPAYTHAINVSEGDKTHGADFARIILRRRRNRREGLRVVGRRRLHRGPGRLGRRLAGRRADRTGGKRRRGFGDARDRSRPRPRSHPRLRHRFHQRGDSSRRTSSTCASWRAATSSSTTSSTSTSRRSRTARWPRRSTRSSPTAPSTSPRRVMRATPTDLTAGTWEGDFLASGAADPGPLTGANLHDFGDGGNSILVDSSPSSTRRSSSGPSTTTSPPATRRPTSTSTTWTAVSP